MIRLFWFFVMSNWDIHQPPAQTFMPKDSNLGPRQVTLDSFLRMLQDVTDDASSIIALFRPLILWDYYELATGGTVLKDVYMYICLPCLRPSHSL